MDFLQFEYFQKVAECENMSSASEILFVSQSTISRAISDLEQEFGTLLFDRQGRRLYLNESGKLLLSYVEKVMDCLHGAEEKIAQRKGQQYTTVEITAKITAEFLAQLHHLFLQLHPMFKLTIRNEPFSDSNTFSGDMILYPSMVPVDDENNRTLFADSICAALPLSHPLAEKKGLNVCDLAKEDMILLPENDRFQKILDGYFQRAGVVPVGKVVCDNYMAILPMVEAGAGISFVPERTWGSLDSYKIKLRPDIAPDFRYYIIFGWKQEDQLRPEARLYRDHLLSYFSTLSNTF